MNNVYGLTFNNNNKTYYYVSNDEYKIGDFCVVETDHGEQYCKIVEIKKNGNSCENKSILRRASDEDTNNFYKNLKDAQSVVIKSKELAKDLNLEMFIINASFSLDRSQLLINFTSDERIDFRELAKKLANVYRTRIELRQIGARDKAKQVGGLGVCGQVLCCSNFLKQIDSVSMSKAKNQNLSLNPTKINGSCGRLLCCLAYEDDVYTECSKGLLNVGTKIKYNGQECTIVGVDILSRTYKVLCNDERIEIKADELKNDSKKRPL